MNIKVITLLSLELEDIEMRAFFTSSEINEFVSNVFFISLLNIIYSYESKFFFITFDNSFIVITAFLLNEDLKLYTCFIISVTRDFTITMFRS